MHKTIAARLDDEQKAAFKALPRPRLENLYAKLHARYGDTLIKMLESKARPQCWYLTKTSVVQTSVDIATFEELMKIYTEAKRICSISELVRAMLRLCEEEE